jgi:hypothetical protein
MKLFTLIAATLSAFYAVTTNAAELSKEPYVPGMGEIMGATQMRHSKLWFAGEAGNWKLADYELSEINEGLDDAVKYYPLFKKTPVATLIRHYTGGPIAGLGKSIAAGDKTQFEKSFDKLTNACNACHRAADHGYIVIKRPGTLPYTNQEFSVSTGSAAR